MLVYVVSDDQIKALRQEAGQAGDSAQVALCDRALDGSRRARGRCAAVIREALGASVTRSGPTLTEARRRELGSSQLKLRLSVDVMKKLRADAKRAGVGLSAYVEGLVSKAR